MALKGHLLKKNKTIKTASSRAAAVYEGEVMIMQWSRADGLKSTAACLRPMEATSAGVKSYSAGTTKPSKRGQKSHSALRDT